MNQETFAVGEAAILVALNLAYQPHHGQEVVITGPLEPGGDERAFGSQCMGHAFRFPNGFSGWSDVRGLRKKPPPGQKRQEAGEWALCPWRPPERAFPKVLVATDGDLVIGVGRKITRREETSK
jgi:hypothetical protein